MPNWKDKTCEKCNFRDDMWCRRNPPNCKVDVWVVRGYPIIRFREGDFQKACGEYKEVDNA